MLEFVYIILFKDSSEEHELFCLQHTLFEILYAIFLPEIFLFQKYLDYFGM